MMAPIDKALLEQAWARIAALEADNQRLVSTLNEVYKQLSGINGHLHDAKVAKFEAQGLILRALPQESAELFSTVAGQLAVMGLMDTLKKGIPIEIPGQGLRIMPDGSVQETEKQS